MPVIEAVLFQVRRVLRLIDELDGSEFPYEDSRLALKGLRGLFVQHEDELVTSVNSVWLNDDIRDLIIPSAAADVSDILPLLGFILRSTNVRNAFEAWGPLSRLSKSVLERDVPLMLSSEWQFSPYTFVGCSQLSGFVLIGFPASESDVPFLLPLAGHELGHTAWYERNIEKEISKEMNQAIIDTIKNNWDNYKPFFANLSENDIDEGGLGYQFWQPAAFWACYQACEVFCDFLGLRLFGESFLHAYAYLLAPQRSGERSPTYPNNKERAQLLVEAAVHYGIDVPDSYVESFVNLPEPSDEEQGARLLLRAADAGRRKVQDQLITLASTVASVAADTFPKEEKVEMCFGAFKQAVPVEDGGGIASILNAGWRALLTTDFFVKQEQESKKAEILSDLILKSLEIFEMEQRIKGVPVA